MATEELHIDANPHAEFNAAPVFEPPERVSNGAHVASLEA
jgi:hypothetical protein